MFCFLCSWDIFKSIEKYSRVSTGGYSGLKNVDAPVPGKSTNKDDHMDSFFMAETLKYLVRMHLCAVSRSVCAGLSEPELLAGGICHALKLHFKSVKLLPARTRAVDVIFIS